MVTIFLQFQERQIRWWHRCLHFKGVGDYSDGCLSGRVVCTVLAVYRAPSGGRSAFLGDLARILPTLPSRSLVVGDLNFDLNFDNDPDSITKDFHNLMSKFGYFNTIFTPTRFGCTKDSLLDHIFCNKVDASFISFTLDTQISDHLPVCLSFVYKSCTKKASTSASIEFTKINYESLAKNINNFNWNSIILCEDFNSAFENFQASLATITAKSSQLIKTKVRSKSRTFKQNWMTDELFDLSAKRTRLHNKAKSEPLNEKLQNDYKAFRNMVTNKIAAAKKKYFSDKYENCRGNQNEKWRFVKQILNKNSSNEDNQNIKLRSHDGSLMEDQNEIVNSFNNFFATIGNTLAEKLPPPTTDFKSYLVDQLDTVPTLNFYEIGPAEILAIINEFSHKKSYWA